MGRRFPGGAPGNSLRIAPSSDVMGAASEGGAKPVSHPGKERSMRKSWSVGAFAVAAALALVPELRGG